MTKTRSIVGIFALLITAMLAAACGTETANVTNTTTKPASSPATTSASPAAEKKDETTTAAKTGVPECDDYLAKVEACVMNKVPAEQRAVFKSSMDQQREAWTKAAANEATKAPLAGACKQAMDTAKNAYSTYGCTF